jgi:hypothetical protein
MEIFSRGELSLAFNTFPEMLRDCALEAKGINSENRMNTPRPASKEFFINFCSVLVNVVLITTVTQLS